MSFQFLFEAGYARRWPHRFGQTVPSDRSSRCKCVLAEVGACSGNDQIADCSRTEAATGVVLVDLVHQFRQICRRRAVQRFIYEQTELELDSLRNSYQWSRSFIMRLTWSPLLHRHNILAASFMTLWSLFRRYFHRYDSCPGLRSCTALLWWGRLLIYYGLLGSRCHLANHSRIGEIPQIGLARVNSPSYY